MDERRLHSRASPSRSCKLAWKRSPDANCAATSSRSAKRRFDPRGVLAARGFFFEGPAADPPEFDTELLRTARAALGEAADWSVEGLEPVLRSAAESAGVKPGKLFQPVRIAVTGSTVAPGIFETLSVLGRDESLARIDAATPTTFVRFLSCSIMSRLVPIVRQEASR